MKGIVVSPGPAKPRRSGRDPPGRTTLSCSTVRAGCRADACRGRHDALRCLADPVDTPAEHEADRFGHLDLANLDLGKPIPRRIREAALLGRVSTTD
jgi:hypothetical protein